MWNGSKERALSQGTIRPFNSKTGHNFDAVFDLVSQQHMLVLSCYTATAMGLITIDED